MIDISARDNGPGIPDQQVELIRWDRETDLRHGNGLGPWLIKWFVESFDGGFDIADRVHIGFRVTVSLPPS